MGALERLAWFKETAWTRRAILAVNLVGVAYGFYYYSFQFAATSPLYWLFVPDSPLAVLYATVALALYETGRRHDVLDALAVIANAKVGLWTAFVLVFYGDHFAIFTDPLTSLNFWLFWGHLGMALEAGIFLEDLRPVGRHGWAGVAGWFLLNDAVDYGLVDPGYFPACDGLRPATVPCVPGKETVLTAVTVGFTLLGLAVAWWGARNVGEGEAAPWVREPRA
jgi:uncharacterized membrane protein YpjA